MKRPTITPALVISLVALFVSLGGTAYAALVITSNSQVAQNTISGHKPPSGLHSNIITGSVNATDLAAGAVTPANIKAPEAWHQVAAGSGTQNLCADATKTAVFCSQFLSGTTYGPWVNFGAGFATAGFYKDQLGIVHLKGLVTSAVRYIGSNPSSVSIFRLPTGYRPTNLRVFSSEGRNDIGLDVAAARITIRPDGLVDFEQDCDPNFNECSADGEYVTLDGISYRPDE